MTVRTADPELHPCVVHSYHSPVVWRTHWHHVIPEAWTLKLGLPESEVRAICPTGHDAMHIAIQLEVRGLKLEHRLDPDALPLIARAVLFWREHEAALTAHGFVQGGIDSAEGLEEGQAPPAR